MIASAMHVLFKIHNLTIEIVISLVILIVSGLHLKPLLHFLLYCIHEFFYAVVAFTNSWNCSMVSTVEISVTSNSLQKNVLNYDD